MSSYTILLAIHKQDATAMTLCWPYQEQMVQKRLVLSFKKHHADSSQYEMCMYMYWSTDGYLNWQRICGVIEWANGLMWVNGTGGLNDGASN